MWTVYASSSSKPHDDNSCWDFTDRSPISLIAASRGAVPRSITEARACVNRHTSEALATHTLADQHVDININTASRELMLEGGTSCSGL